MAYADSSNDTFERRRSLRKHVLWAAQVGANARELDCTILDVSLGGARIRLEEEVPSRGPVSIASERFGTFHAEVIWESESIAGLRFLESQARVAQTIGRHVPLS
jgi:hypothetical protein